MNMKTRNVSIAISVLMLMLTIVLNINVDVVSAYPGYLENYNSIYGGGSCSTCHSEGQTFNWLNSYGTLFRDQTNHVTDPKAALITIGAPVVDTTTKDKFKVGPTIRITPMNDEITEDQDGLVLLSLYNPGENSVSMNADIRIQISPILHVYGQDFIKLTDSTPGKYDIMYGKFDITPGETKEVYIHFKTDVQFGLEGSYSLLDVKFTGTYHPGNNKDAYQPISFVHTFKANKVVPTPVVTSTPIGGGTPVPTYVQETLSPTINFYGDKTDVNVGENILTKLSILNPVSNPNMHVQVIITPSSGMSMTSEYFTKISPDQFSADYELNPGNGRYIKIMLRSNQAGEFNIKGRVVYYFGNDNENTQDYVLDLPIRVRTLVTHTPTPSPISVVTANPTPVVTTFVKASDPSLTRAIGNPEPSTGLYSFDNIQVDHTIRLCDVASDAEREITGGSLQKNCGKTVFSLEGHPLDLFPSGGNSGKISASELVYVDIVTSGSMSVIPWRTQTVNMKWYDGSDNRLIYSATNEADNIFNYAWSLIGHFSHEIKGPGKYYIDVEVVNWGTQRIVFDVIGDGDVGVTANPTPIGGGTPVVTYTARPIVTPVIINTPKPETLEVPDPGCWDSALGFGMCAGDVATRTVVGIFLGIGKGIVTILGV